MAKALDLKPLKGALKMTPNEYASLIMFLAGPTQLGLDVANQMNHEALYRYMITYDQFRVAANCLVNIILAR